MDNYEINTSTLAIIPINDKITKIYEEETEYIVKEPANDIIKNNCKFFGSSYEGRCIGTQSLTGIKSKLPIIIEESRNIIFFPTSSIRNQQSSWIALNKIKYFSKSNIGPNGIITFKNHKTVPLNISYYSLGNQIVRATMLQTKLYEKIKEEK